MSRRVTKVAGPPRAGRIEKLKLKVGGHPLKISNSETRRIVARPVSPTSALLTSSGCPGRSFGASWARRRPARLRWAWSRLRGGSALAQRA